MEQTFALLQALAKIVKKPIETCNYHNSNAPSETFTRSLTYSKTPYKIRVYASNRYLLIEIRGFLSSFCFSINKPDHILFLEDKYLDIQIGKDNLPIYSDKRFATNLSQFKEWILSSQNKKSLELVNFQPDESLHFAKNSLDLYMRPRPANEVLVIIDALYQLVNNLPKYKEGPVDLKKLPVEFHKLIPLIRKWDVSNDVERNERLTQLSIKEKESLYQKVKPYFHKINQYLDSFGDKPLPEEAISLQNLGEVAAELKIKMHKSL